MPYPPAIMAAIAVLLILLIVVVGFFSISKTGNRGVDLAKPLMAPVLYLIPVLPIVYAIVRLRCRKRTHYTIYQGWIHIQTGGFFCIKHYQSYELLHLIEAEVSCGPLDQLTGNGVLLLKFEHGINAELRGLGPIEEIRQLPYDLMNLTRLMRSSSLVRSGIIA